MQNIQQENESNIILEQPTIEKEIEIEESQNQLFDLEKKAINEIKPNPFAAAVKVKETK